jgi:hypothetical protein
VPQNKYQGVYFKFGSLVGIAPVGSKTGATVYVPTYVPFPGDTLSSTWSGSDTISSGFTNYEGIPYVSTGLVSPGDRSNRYVSNLGISLVDEKKGDICLYLEHTGAAPPRPRAELHWRLPTSAEFGPQNDTWDNNGWIEVNGANGSSGAWDTDHDDPSDDGKRTSIGSGGKFGTTGNFFPASADRNTDGSLRDTGNYGHYWSGSVYSTASIGYYLHFITGGASPYVNANRQYGFSVRCVLRE